MSSAARNGSRRFLVPEVVQTSAMDCGPATLKCLLEGFGVSVSYGRLREACQTDVDGTSIDTLEDLCNRLGFEAEQIMLPPDHLLISEAEALPAIVVVRLPNGLTHFLVAWRRDGQLVQVMDPAVGRRWMSSRQFLSEVYTHTLSLPAAYWREWAGSTQFIAPLRRRLASVGCAPCETTRLIEIGLADPGWAALAALDSVTRLVQSVVDAKALRRGRQASRLLGSLFDRIWKNPSSARDIIPETYWSALPGVPTVDGQEQLLVRGAVLIRVQRRKPSNHASDTSPLSVELAAALAEPPNKPGRELLKLVREDGYLAPAAVAAALATAAGGLILEALLFRGLFDLGRDLPIVSQRLGAIGIVILFALALLLLDFPIASTLVRFGRRLELRLRMAFLTKIPRLVDRYFQSRLTSDMAERCHSIHRVRLLPEMAGELLRSSFELALTVAGIIWLDPRSAPLALLAGLIAIGLPLSLTPFVRERDLRLRTHTGALTRFYLDALLGLVAVRVHGAERAVRSEHESLLTDWARAGATLQRTVVWVEGIQSFAGFGLAAWLLFAHLNRGDEITGGALLLIYWALNLPVLGQEIALLARQYPAHRNATLRLLEPLGAPEEVPESASSSLASVQLERGGSTSDGKGVAIAFEQVSILAAGRTILQDINLQITPGTHLAIVGRSGAGKSSLVGLLLGWHRPAMGRVLVDGDPLDSRRLEQLRQETAWVDPAVQLWNRPFLENLRYGSWPGRGPSTASVLDAADLVQLVAALPDGMQTPLGEGGALVSSGEGQRVRLGRALQRPRARLVILDEAFRGLERDRRKQLLTVSRQVWERSTLVCITHDVLETQSFHRVLVIEGGRVVEDGSPADLKIDPGSRYHALLETERLAWKELWSSGLWRHLWVEHSRIEENQPSVDLESIAKERRSRTIPFIPGGPQ